MGKVSDDIVTVLVAIISLAMVAVLVGRNAKTSQVLDSFGKFFTGAISAAVKPVT